MHESLEKIIDEFNKEFKCDCYLCKTKEHRFETTHAYMLDIIMRVWTAGWDAGIKEQLKK